MIRFSSYPGNDLSFQLEFKKNVPQNRDVRKVDAYSTLTYVHILDCIWNVALHGVSNDVVNYMVHKTTTEIV